MVEKNKPLNQKVDFKDSNIIKYAKLFAGIFSFALSNVLLTGCVDIGQNPSNLTETNKQETSTLLEKQNNLEENLKKLNFEKVGHFYPVRISTDGREIGSGFVHPSGFLVTANHIPVEDDKYISIGTTDKYNPKTNIDFPIYETFTFVKSGLDLKIITFSADGKQAVKNYLEKNYTDLNSYNSEIRKMIETGEYFTTNTYNNSKNGELASVKVIPTGVLIYDSKLKQKYFIVIEPPNEYLTNGTSGSQINSKKLTLVHKGGTDGDDKKIMNEKFKLNNGVWVSLPPNYTVKAGEEIKNLTEILDDIFAKLKEKYPELEKFNTITEFMESVDYVAGINLIAPLNIVTIESATIIDGPEKIALNYRQGGFDFIEKTLNFKPILATELDEKYDQFQKNANNLDKFLRQNNFTPEEKEEIIKKFSDNEKYNPLTKTEVTQIFDRIRSGDYWKMSLLEGVEITHGQVFESFEYYQYLKFTDKIDDNEYDSIRNKIMDGYYDSNKIDFPKIKRELEAFLSKNPPNTQQAPNLEFIKSLFLKDEQTKELMEMVQEWQKK